MTKSNSSSKIAKERFFAIILICSMQSLDNPLKCIVQPVCRGLLGSLSIIDVACGSNSGILDAISFRSIIASPYPKLIPLTALGLVTLFSFR